MGRSLAAGATDFIWVEHILLAILRERESVPAQVVAQLGYMNAIVEVLDRLLRSEGYRGGSTTL